MSFQKCFVRHPPSGTPPNLWHCLCSKMRGTVRGGWTWCLGFQNHKSEKQNDLMRSQWALQDTLPSIRNPQYLNILKWARMLGKQIPEPTRKADGLTAHSLFTILHRSFLSKSMDSSPCHLLALNWVQELTMEGRNPAVLRQGQTFPLVSS